MIRLTESLKTSSARLIGKNDKALEPGQVALKLCKESSIMEMQLLYRIRLTSYRLPHTFKILALLRNLLRISGASHRIQMQKKVEHFLLKGC